MNVAEFGPFGRRKEPTAEDIARFFSKVDKNGPVIDPALGPCWMWTRARLASGYGQFSIGLTNRLAHRISWFLHFGPIPNEALVCHKCDNPPCVNPTHLYLGDGQSNGNDRAERGAAKFRPALAEIRDAYVQRRMHPGMYSQGR